MAFDFPASPSEGQVFTPAGGPAYRYSSGVWTVATSLTSFATISDGAPSSPVPGQLWWESDTGNLYIWFDDGNSQQWVQLNGPAIAADIEPAANCYLDWSGTNLLLRREQGTRLFINGVNETIPVSGVTLAATGLTTTGGIAGGWAYHIYAYMNAGVMTLEAVATAPVVSNTHGLKVKSTDVSRTYVGMAGVSGAATWGSGLQVYCASQFNPKWRVNETVIASNTAGVGFAASSAYNYFVSMGDRPVQAAMYARAFSHSAAAQDHQADLRIGPTGGPYTSVFNSTTGNLTSRLSAAAGSASQFLAFNQIMDRPYPASVDGSMLAQVYLASSSSTATFYGLTQRIATWG